MDLKKTGQFIYASIVGIVCIMIGLFQYVNNNEITLKDIAILLLLYFLSIKKTVNLNIFLRLLQVKKKLDLNKVGFFSMLILACSYLITGFLYNHFCTDKIAMRENHLSAVSQILIPPENAIKMREFSSNKMFYRKHSMYYKYEEEPAEGIKHYTKELLKHGYEVKRVNRSQLEARKDEIRIKIDFEEKELLVYIMFDDIFTKLNL